MKVLDLPADQEGAYFKCLEEWSPEFDDAGNHKEKWYRRMVPLGLRVKIAVDDTGVPGGMIQYGPIENTGLEGTGLYYMYCIWVHGYEKGRGNFQKRGMGTALLEAAEEDSRELGAKGFVTWGMILPFFMRASWFKKKGYSRVDRDGIAELLWKPFGSEAVPPRWLKQKKPLPTSPGKVSVTCFLNGWCPVRNMTFERARRAAEELGDRVAFSGIDTFAPETVREWGVSDGLFIDGKPFGNGPPRSYEKIFKAVSKKLR